MAAQSSFDAMLDPFLLKQNAPSKLGTGLLVCQSGFMVYYKAGIKLPLLVQPKESKSLVHCVKQT